MTGISRLSRVSRRGLLLGAAAVGGGVASSILGMPFISRGLAAGPIKIGVTFAPAAIFGRGPILIREGVGIALELAGGKAAGQPVEFVFAEEPDPAGAVASLKKLVNEDKVAGIIGGTLVDGTKAMQAAAAEAKVPFITHSAMADALTGEFCNPWSFRVPIPFSVHFRAMLPYLTGYGSKWFILGINTTQSQELVAVIRSMMKAAGATEVGFATVQAGSGDFAEAITKIKEAKPDAIVGSLFLNNLTHFLKSWHAAGMKGKIPFAQVAFSDAEVLDAGREAATGVYTKNWHFTDPKNGRDDKAMTAAFIEENKKPPLTRTWQAYMAAKSLLTAIDKAEGPDPAKVRAALETIRIPNGDVIRAFRDFDHQMMYRVPILEVKSSITADYDFWDAEAHFPEKNSELSAAFGTREQLGCKMVTA